MNKTKRTLAAFISVVLLFSAINLGMVVNATSSIAIVEFSAEDDFADNRVIVIFDNETSLQCDDITIDVYKNIGCKSIRDISSYTGTQVKTMINNIEQHVLYGENLLPYDGIALGKYNKVVCMELDQNDKENVIEVLKKLQKQDNVLYAIPDYKFSVCGSLDSTDYYAQYQSGMYEMIGLDKVWDYDFSEYYNNNSNSTIRIGVVDSGIDANHEDYQYSNNKCVVNTQLSKNFGDTTSAIQDNHGHGTMCAGIIAAVRNNGIGVSGVCGDQDLNIELVSLKVHENGDGYSSDVWDAIDYARVNGIDILNISLGWCLGTDSEEWYEKYYKESIDQITEDFPGLIVCAAGNMAENEDEANDNDLIHNYPSCWEKSYVIAVGSCESSSRAYYSNYGAECVDIFAPGTGVYSTFPDERCQNATHQLSNCQHEGVGYHSGFGTSFAAPYVAGLAALMLRVDSSLTPEEIKSYFINSADPSTTLAGECVSGGTLNAFNAVMLAVDHTNHNCNITHNYPSHTFTCSDCDYTYSEEHNYVVVREVNNITIVCDFCEFECLHTKTYTSHSSHHTISCNTCNYSVNENHIKTYRPSTLATMHIVLCSACGYSYNEHHVWMSMADMSYQCIKCKKISFEAPETLSIDEEGQLSEIVVALPPINDEENLTE